MPTFFSRQIFKGQSSSKKNGFEVEILLVVKADKLSKDKGVSKVQIAHCLHLGSKNFVFLLT